MTIFIKIGQENGHKKAGRGIAPLLFFSSGKPGIFTVDILMDPPAVDAQLPSIAQ